MAALSKYKTYPEYKDSGIEWLGEIPKHWEPVKLKHIVTLSNQKATNLTDHQYVGMENIESKTAKYITTENIIPEGVSNQFKKGDILFGKLRPYLAKAWLATFSGVCSSELLVLKNHKLFSDFLKAYLLTNNVINEINSSTYGSKMPRASWDFIGQIPVPFMPYEESKKIAQFLDHETAKIDQLIEKQQTLIELLKEKRQAVISHAVTKGLDPKVKMKDSGVEWLGEVPEHWGVTAISKITDKITNGYVGPTRDILVPEGIPYVQATHIKKGRVNFDEAYFVREKWSNEHSKSILKKGDVLIVQTGAGTGDIGTVSESEEGFNCHALIILQPKKNLILGEYLAYVLQSDYGFSILYSIRTGGMHPHLNCGEVKFVKVPVPNDEEQKNILVFIKNKISQFELLIQKAEQQIELMKERRSALISAAVTGKIDVRDWPPEQ